MRTFVVYAKIELTSGSKWLDYFRAKYDKPYEYHITLKQPCVVEENKVEDIKSILSNLVNNLDDKYKNLTVQFNELHISPDQDNKYCIMIGADNQTIKEFQKLIVESLKEYKNFRKPEYEDYEINFVPHITIGRDIDESKIEQAKQELPGDITAKGKINDIVLVVVDLPVPEQANDPGNQTRYSLS